MPPLLTPTQQRLYQKLRLLLWILILAGGSSFALSTLFPSVTHQADFSNPKSLSSTDVELVSAANEDFSTTGKVPAHASFTAVASHLGDFSSLALQLKLESDSFQPQSFTATIRRGNAAAFLPLGEPLIQVTEAASLFLIDDTYYRLEQATLVPFVSAAAYHSRYPDSQAVIHADATLFERYPKADTPIGFRVGSLLSFADGVFIVTSESEIRPVGSAEIFLALGYRFEDVKPASEEELGIYHRGRIILLSTNYADGTLFTDISQPDVLFIIQDGKRHALLDIRYRDFLITQQQPIAISSADVDKQVSCVLNESWLPQTYRCTATIDVLKNNLGFDYEVTITGSHQAVELRSFTMVLDTHVTIENARRILSKVKQRILERFGIAL